MAEDKPKKSKWRLLWKDDPQAPLTGEILSADGQLRRDMLIAGAAFPVAAASGAAEAVIAPTAGELATSTAPTAMIADGAAATSATETGFLKMVAYLAPQIGTLATIIRNTSLNEKRYISHTFQTGLPPLKKGIIDEYKLQTFLTFQTNIYKTHLLSNLNLRSIKLSELTKENIEQSMQINGFKETDPSKILKLFNTWKMLAGSSINQTSTLGELADILSQKSRQVVINIVAHPELMPAYYDNALDIYRHLEKVVVASKAWPEGPIKSPLLDEIAALKDKVIKNREEKTARERAEREREQIEEKEKRQRDWEERFKPEESIKNKKDKPITCCVYNISPPQKDKEKGIRTAFLIRPIEEASDLNIPGGLTSAHIRRFCQQLKDAGKLDSNFRPASVQSEWLEAPGAYDYSESYKLEFGMRVSTADWKLRNYLTQCAQNEETIVIPALTRYESQGPGTPAR